MEVVFGIGTLYISIHTVVSDVSGKSIDSKDQFYLDGIGRFRDK